MSSSPRSCLPALVFAALMMSSVATGASSDERRARIAVKATTARGSRTLTVGELEDRLAEIPPFQAATFGATDGEVVRAYVDQVIVRDLVLGAGAEQRNLDDTLPTKQLLQRAKSTATLRAIRAPFKSPAAIPAADVSKYYEENRSRFESPERINLWRILCRTEGEAASVLASAKQELTIATYNDLARDHSIDKATHLRGGNLGFVDPDGASNEAGLKVDPILMRAAATVKDGELVPQAVPEGAAYAVVWRRTTTPATHRSVEEAAAQIRTTLFRERTEAAEKALIDELRAKSVHDLNSDLLKIIEIPAVDAGFSIPRSIPGSRSSGENP
jgi:peptidyl-prolyl cis-trans isomerase C